MASFSSLPTELLTYIFHLLNRGQPAEGLRRSPRARFSLISRACFHAVPAADDFSTGGQLLSKRLLAKLETEREWEAQERRRARTARTTRSVMSILRVTTIRRLSLIVGRGEWSGEVYAKILLATPNLVALEFNAVGITYGPASSRNCAPLTVALKGLVHLKELNFRASIFDTVDLLRILTPLQELEVLDLDIYEYYPDGAYQSILSNLALTQLHTLRINLTDESPISLGFCGAVVRTLTTGSTVGIHTLAFPDTPLGIPEDLGTTDGPLIPDPYLAKILHFTWSPWKDTPSPAGRVAVHALVGAMTSLQTIEMDTWLLDYYPYTDVLENDPFDPSLLDTLATLPSLQSVHLVAREGKVDEIPVISFINSHTTLHHLSFRFQFVRGWTPEQRGRVELAAQRAGVTQQMI